MFTMASIYINHLWKNMIETNQKKKRLSPGKGSQQLWGKNERETGYYIVT